MDADDIPAYIADCEARESKLSDWERSFIQSISEQFAKTGSLSTKQMERLDEIWEKVT
jgi:hypothetical protein